MNDPFKMQTLTAPTNNTGKKPADNQKSNKVSNFIENFKEQGQAATTGVAKTVLEQIFGSMDSNYNQFPQTQNNIPNNFNTPGQKPFNFAEFLRSRENFTKMRERQFAQQQRSQERLIFSRKNEETKKEIELLKQEIKKLIKTSKDVTAEILAAEKTIMTTTVEAGTYQVNFFQRVRRMIMIARKRLQDSQNWLQLFNSRQRQKAGYWGNVKKSGTKYMLSNERYMSTQAG
ncbi:hypothetical protein GYA19_04460 [Candidatus Beckwithbacteria bacterium]|nr:hypothetical protein [Candidatus Beckwithbacteria bacterium]